MNARQGIRPAFIARRIVAVTGLALGGGALCVSAAEAEVRPVHGSLHPLRAPTSCIVFRVDPGEPCVQGVGLNSVTSVAISPDGRNLYSAAGFRVAYPSDTAALAIFDRDRQTGLPTQKPDGIGCIKRADAAQREGLEGCATARALEGLRVVALSRDGRQVYAGGHRGIAVFSRDRRTGELRQLDGRQGCVTRDVVPEGTHEGRLTRLRDGCATGRAVNITENFALSADGRFVYAATLDDAVVAFRRDRRDGSLRQLTGRRGCVKQRGTRPATGGPAEGCAPGRGMGAARSVTLSPDGRRLYVAALRNAVAVFAVDRATGALRQLPGRAGCVAEDGSQGCARGRGLFGPHLLTISADGRSGYLAGKLGRSVGNGKLSSIAVFRIDRTTGALRQLRDGAGCFMEGGTDGCADGRVIVGAHQAVIAPDGLTVYGIADGFDGGVSVFRRHPRTGRLRQLPGAAGCVNEKGALGCTPGRHTGGLHFGVVSPDARLLHLAGEDALSLTTLRIVGRRR